MAPSENSIQLIIADDHHTVRRGLKDFFAQQKTIEVVGVAANGREALELVSISQPDVLLTDIRMDVMDGRELCKTIRRKFPDVAVIAFTMYDDETGITDMRLAGARGYVLKTSDETEILKAINTVHEGGEYYCTEIRKRIDALFKTGCLGTSTQERKHAFSETELRITKLICEEFSSKEIGEKLGLSRRAVEHHKERIQNKMNVKGAVGIALYAIKHWLLY